MKTVIKSVRYYLLKCLIIILFSFIGVNAQFDTSVDLFKSSPIATPEALDHIEITGPDEVYENSGGNYNCWANYSDGRRENVTTQTSWSENSDYASFERPGHLVTSEVNSDQSCTIEAHYGGKRTNKAVTIKNIILNSIEISGPYEVDESSSADYTCTANYSDGSNQNVTSLATWSENSGYASISSSGHLTTSSVNSDETCTIETAYGGQEAHKIITIKNVSGIYNVVIDGPSEVNENSNAQYTCVFEYFDGTSSDVTLWAYWDVNSSCASIACGYLTTSEVTSDQLCTISVHFSGVFEKNILIKNVLTNVSGLKDGKIPRQFSLSQNYPNPFNPSTNIHYNIPKRSFVELTIYNELGMEIESIVSEEKAPGEYKVEWNAKEYPSGIYLCRLEAGDFVETRKLILQK